MSRDGTPMVPPCQVVVTTSSGTADRRSSWSTQGEPITARGTLDRNGIQPEPLELSGERRRETQPGSTRACESATLGARAPGPPKMARFTRGAPGGVADEIRAVTRKLVVEPAATFATFHRTLCVAGS